VSHREELELKYEVDDLAATAATLDDLFPRGEGPDWQHSSVDDLFFDTPDQALAMSGIGARLRGVGERWTVTLKSTVKVKGPRHLRAEIEGAATEVLDPADWPASPARELLEEVAGPAPLLPRFRLCQQRRERELWLTDGRLMASVDDVVVLTVDGRELGRLRGLEVEFLAGRRRTLRRVAKRIESTGLARPEPLSKMQLAHSLVAARQRLEAYDLLAEAGRKVLSRHLATMLEREAAVKAGDTLALKQMRVATRRMRSAWRVFDGAYRRSEHRRYVAQLRVLARRLGEVRDLEVLIAGLPAEQAIKPLAEAWRSERTQAMERLLAHLGSPGHARFVADFRFFVGSPGAAVARQSATTPVRDVAGPRILETYTELLRLGRELDPADHATFHGLRIGGKRLRYALETFGDLLPPEPMTRCRSRLIALQDALGELNDCAVAADRAERWLSAQETDLQLDVRAAVEAHVARLAEQREAAASSAVRIWRAVASPTFQQDLEALAAAVGR